MRLVTYRSERGARAGLLRDGGVVDAGQALGRGACSVRELLAAERLPELAEAAGEASALDEVELLPPVPDPDKIVCIGLNYRAHAGEAGQEAPPSPTFFAKFRQRAGAAPVPPCRCRRPAARLNTRPRLRS